MLNEFDSKLNTLNTGASVVDTITIKSADGTTHDIAVTVKGDNECPTWTSPYAGIGDANDNDGTKAGVAFATLSATTLKANNVAYGTTGSDAMDGKAGDDVLFGWGGNDTLCGSDGNDTLYGGSGADTLDGGIGNDALYGGSGNDKLLGGDGNDLLVGGYGADTMTGGAGIDTFRFLDVRDTGDTITDFVHGVDRIDLSLLSANGTLVHFADATEATKFSPGHNLIYYFDGTNTVVLANTDNDPNTAEFKLVLTGNVHLSAIDFIL